MGSTSDETGYDAVVFDNDGVLTDPTDFDAVRAAIRETFRDHGVTDPPDEHIDAALRADVEAVVVACETHGLDPEAFWRDREANSSRAQREWIRTGRKALYDDVAAVSELDLPLGIVSNNQHRTVEYIAEFFGLDAFEVVYGREPTIDGARRIKPEPHYIERALSDLGVDDALYVGDSNADVAAANSLGLDSAFVWRPHRDGYDLVQDPTYEIGSLEELPALIADEDGSG